MCSLFPFAAPRYVLACSLVNAWETVSISTMYFFLRYYYFYGFTKVSCCLFFPLLFHLVFRNSL